MLIFDPVFALNSLLVATGKPTGTGNASGRHFRLTWTFRFFLAHVGNGNKAPFTFEAINRFTPHFARPIYRKLIAALSLFDLRQIVEQFRLRN